MSPENYSLPECVFWDVAAAGKYTIGLSYIVEMTMTCCYVGGIGDWSSEGCYNMSRNSTTVVCECNHLSLFGVLVVRERLH